MPSVMTEAMAEKAIDRRVQSRLSSDRAYRNAEDAETQSAREDEITAEEERAVLAEAIKTIQALGKRKGVAELARNEHDDIETLWDAVRDDAEKVAFDEMPDSITAADASDALYDGVLEAIYERNLRR